MRYPLGRLSLKIETLVRCHHMKFLMKIFREFFPLFAKRYDNSQGYWKRRYFYGGNSGKGSYGDEAIYKAKILNEFVREYKIKSLVEFGCGDGNNALLYRVKKYYGFDISADAINSCKKLFASNVDFEFFEIDGQLEKGIDIVKKNTNSYNNLCISFDVIFHLVEDIYYNEYLDNLDKVQSKFLLVYSSNFNQKTNQPHVLHRNYSVDLENRNWKIIQKLAGATNQKEFILFQRIPPHKTPSV